PAGFNGRLLAMSQRDRILAALLIVGTLGTKASAVQAVDDPPKGAYYKDPKPDAFMTRWLTCGPFSVCGTESKPCTEQERKQAFGRDYLSQHGGEAEIQPTPGLMHRSNETKYQWRAVTGDKNAVDLAAVYGAKEDVVAYAWAEIEMSTDTAALLGIGSDDAVK